MLEDVYWQIQGRVIVERYSGLITLADIEQGKVQTLEMLLAELQDAVVHIVIDAMGREAYAAEVLKLPVIHQILRADDLKAQVGWLIIINPVPHPIMRFLLTAAARIGGNHLKIVPSMEAALQFLYENDASLSEANHPL